MATVESSLTIADVECHVGQFGPQMIGQYADIDRIMREARHEYPEGLFGYRREPVTAPIKHQHLLSALGYIRSALLNTRYRFEAVAGSDRILHTLEDEFRAMLRQLMMNRSMPARVIVVDGDLGKFRSIAQEHPEALRIVAAQSVHHPIEHFFTSDYSTAREEPVHPPLTDAMRPDVLPAEYYPNNRSKVTVLQSLFGAYWKRLTGEGEPEPPRRKWWPFGRK